MSLVQGLRTAALFGLSLLALPLGSLPAQAATAVPALDHVFVIVMENQGYSNIIGSTAAPYTNSLLSSAGVATSYYAVTHPSLPNYLALTGASTFGITSDCTTCWISASNVADNLEAVGKSWKTYQESMPSACYVGDSYPYVQKHNPFVYFNNIRTNASRCQSHVVPYTQMATDLASASTTPNYAFITPNICNDMHDCAIATGDTWLSQQIPQILASPAFTTQRSMLALVWDEDDFSGTNQVPAILIGGGVTAGLRSAGSYNHYSLLHTFESALGLNTLTTNDAGASAMADFFAASTPPPPPPPPPAPAGWSSVGGIATSGPAISSGSSTKTDVFVRGTDNGLWHRSWSGSAWSNWDSLGGYATSNAAVVAQGTRIDLFVRGSDNQLYHEVWDGTRWSVWEALGGILTSGPTVASWGAGRLDVFVRGTDNGLWHRWWDGVKWSGWESLGGILTTDPAAVSWGQNRIDVLVRGTDNGLWQESWDGTAWSSWRSLGGLLTSGPAISSCSAGHLDALVLGSDSAIYRLGYAVTAWDTWRRLDGQWTANPGAVCRPATTQVDLVARGSDSAVWQTAVVGS